jgi:tRNA A37 methylthiotransferase MiaB
MTLPDHIDPALMNERISELRGMQDDITASRRDDLIGQTVQVLVDEVGIGRTHREAPSIDGVVHVSNALAVGQFADVEIADALGPDLIAVGADTAQFDEEE